MTAEDINKLPKEQIGQLSAIDVLTTQVMDQNTNAKTAKIFSIIMIENLLNDLKFYNSYPTGALNDNLKNAVKNFQTSIHSNATGTLTMNEFSKLLSYEEQISPKEIIPLTGSDNSKAKIILAPDNDTAEISGTWVGEDEFPIQLSQIICSKEKNECTESNVVLTDSTSDKSLSFLTLVNYSYGIIQWTNTEIIAETFSKCHKQTLKINLINSEVSLIENNNSPIDCNLGNSKLSNFQNPRIKKLVGGFNTANEYFHSQQKERHTLYNSAYFEVIQNLLK
jgi:hypothetical protein